MAKWDSVINQRISLPILKLFDVLLCINSNSVQGEITRVGIGIDSEPDPYETKLKSVADAHNFSALGKISKGDPNDNPCPIEVKVSFAVDRLDEASTY